MDRGITLQQLFDNGTLTVYLNGVAYSGSTLGSTSVPSHSEGGIGGVLGAVVRYK